MRERKVFQTYAIVPVSWYRRRPPGSGKYAKKWVYVSMHFRAAPYTGPIADPVVHLYRMWRRKGE